MNESPTDPFPANAFPAKPETYYLYRGFQVRQTANGYLVEAGFPVRFYTPEGKHSDQRVWNKAMLIFTNTDDLMRFLETYFTCSPHELDAMADRYYRHDVAEDTVT